MQPQSPGTCLLDWALGQSGDEPVAELSFQRQVKTIWVAINPIIKSLHEKTHVLCSTVVKSAFIQKVEPVGKICKTKMNHLKPGRIKSSVTWPLSFAEKVWDAWKGMKVCPRQSGLAKNLEMHQYLDKCIPLPCKDVLNSFILLQMDSSLPSSF